MVKVINIKPEHEVLLSFLYPEYSITDSASVVNKFIVHRQVKSLSERETLNHYYDQGIFISSQIFDEIWDENKLKELCIEYARVHFKSRKKTLLTSSETFVQDCVNFMFGITSEVDETDILELFDTVGSKSFPVKFFNMCESVPYSKLFSALLTFTSKLNVDTTSAYYKKKYLNFGPLIKKNLMKSIDTYTERIQDYSGCSECKFIMNLYEK